jgi:hypothetical protein
MTVKKSIFYVELMNMPVLRYGKREDNANSGSFYNRTERLIKVDARLLSEPTHHPSSFMTSERSVRVIFVAKDPFATNNVGTGRGRDKSPCIVCHKSVILLLHGKTPGGVMEGGEVVVWQWGCEGDGKD